MGQEPAKAGLPVTPEMIEVGVAELSGYDETDSAYETVRRILNAALAVSQSAQPGCQPSE